MDEPVTFESLPVCRRQAIRAAAKRLEVPLSTAFAMFSNSAALEILLLIQRTRKKAKGATA